MYVGVWLVRGGGTGVLVSYALIGNTQSDGVSESCTDVRAL